MPDGTIQRYQDIEDRWRWRLVASDGHPLADGTTIHDSGAALGEHIDRLRTTVPTLDIADGGEGYVLMFETEVRALDDTGTVQAVAPITDRFRVSDGSVDDLSWDRCANGETSWLSRALPSLPVHTVDPGLFVIIRGHDGEWRWHLWLDGRHVADSGEGYGSKAAAVDAIERTQSAIETADMGTWGSVQNA